VPGGGGGGRTMKAASRVDYDLIRPVPNKITYAVTCMREEFELGGRYLAMTDRTFYDIWSHLSEAGHTRPDRNHRSSWF
jgi:hypothetical protein